MTAVDPDDLTAAPIGELDHVCLAPSTRRAAHCEARVRPAGRGRAPERRTTRPGGRTPSSDAGTDASAAFGGPPSGPAPAAARSFAAATPRHASRVLGHRRDEPVPLVVAAQELALLVTVTHEEEQVPVGAVDVDHLQLHSPAAAGEAEELTRASEPTSMRGAPTCGPTMLSRAPIAAKRRSRTSVPMAFPF